MSKMQNRNTDQELDERRGPSLLLLYTFVLLGLLLAMGFAAMVIWPFYLRR